MIGRVPNPSTLSSWISVPCNLCRTDHTRTRFVSPGWKRASLDPTLFRAADDRYGDYGQIVECRTCGLVYTNPRLPEQDLLKAYAGIEDPEYKGEDASRSINGHFSLNTISQYVSAGKLLDVGCSTGYFLNAARLHFDASGVEPSRWAGEFARTQLRLEVRTGTLEEARLPTQSFDVVSLIDVIEHLADPLATLKEAARVLKTGGLLYLVTPDVDSLTARLMGSRWWGLRPAHIYYFSKKSLARILKEAGFEVVITRSFGRVFTLDYWLSRLRHYSSPVNRLLRWGIERWALNHKLVYINTMDSIECCARRVG